MGIRILGATIAQFLPIFAAHLKREMFRPIYSFAFLFSCLGILGLVGYVGQGKSIQVAGVKLRFFSLSTHQNLTAQKDSQEKHIAQINLLEAQVNADTFVAPDRQRPSFPPVPPVSSAALEYPNQDKSALQYFFRALRNAHITQTHILHYGDSQIEGDRFSGFLRQKLQKILGGKGYGWVPFMSVHRIPCLEIKTSQNWQKWTCYAQAPRNSIAYGPMAQTFTYEGSFENALLNISCIKPQAPCCQHNLLKIYYGYAQPPVTLYVFQDQRLLYKDTLSDQAPIACYEVEVSGAEKITLEFEGAKSPHFYGISLESKDPGIYVHNIPLRGSSGTFFHRIPTEILKAFFQLQKVSLVILQFGGNALPSIDSREKAYAYASYIDAQIKRLRQISPEVSILFIGPADMSVNHEGTLQTHPYLEEINALLKKIVFANHGAYFDMYHAMGGKNSMLTWVEKGLAAGDYIHFSEAGARKMASMLYYALIRDFEAYEKEH
ncbi:MAG: GDSL-type esterase/lipase family protein [Bacteroidia bacterium]